MQPVITESWIHLHKQIVACCPEAGESPESCHLPGKWVPHITLASRLKTDEVVKSTEWLVENFSVLSGFLDRLAVIDCDLEEVIFERKLKATTRSGG